MAPGRKQSRWQDSAQESVAQAFLEAAGPIILENRQLTPESRAQLEEVAKRFGLTDSQLDLELQLLHDRGVIQVPQAPRPKRPAPVGDPAQTPSPAPPASAQRTSATVLEILDDQPVAPPAPATRPPAAPPRPKPTLPPISRTVTDTAPPTVAPLPTPAAPLPSTPAPQGIEAFLERAMLLIAQHRGLTTPCRALLEQTARECGVSSAEAHEAILQLQAVPTPGAKVLAPGGGLPTSGGIVPTSGGSAESASSPPPAPAVAAPEGGPAEEFRHYLRQVFAQLSSGFLSEAAEQKLVRTGRKQHLLSSVYVRHLLQQVAAEARIRLPGQAAAGENSHGADAPAVNPAENSKIQQFLTKAAPIIAEHRGVNARSRLFLTAVARDQGLSNDELERALDQLLGRTSGAADRALAEQLAERNASYRTHLREALPSVEHGIIVSKKRRKLLDAGEFQEGLPREMADATLREVAAELGVRLISQERAAEHVERLLDDLMGNRVRVSAEARERILAEAAQWGLTIEHTNALIIDRVKANQRRRMWESQRTKLLWGAAFVILLGVVCWLGFLLTKVERPVSGSSDPATPPADGTSSETGTTQEKPDEWWDTSLQIAIMNARLADSAWIPELEKIQSTEEAERAETYDRILKLAQGALDKPQALKSLGDILAGSCALEPSEANAQHILQGLLQTIPQKSEDVPETDAPFRLGYWATRVIATGLSYRAGMPDRSQSLAIEVSNHLNAVIDPAQRPAEIEKDCLAAASTKMYETLIAAASFQPRRARGLHAAVAAEAEKVLEATELDRLEARFVAALVPRLGDGWKEFEEPIRKLVSSPDAVTVMTLVEMYERCPNREVQDYMTRLLLARSSARLTDRSVEKVGLAVRDALGVRVAATQEGRWDALQTKAEGVLSTSGSSITQPESLFQEIISLAHYSSAACALVQKDLGAATFDQLVRDGPSRLHTDEAGISTFDTPPKSSRPRLDPILDRLQSQNPPRRIPALQQLKEVLPALHDLTPEEAAQLAKYLVRRRSGAESEMVHELVEHLTRFVQLRIALADAVADAKLRDAGVEEMLTHFTNRKVDSPDLEVWKKVTQQELLKGAVQQLGPGGEASAASADLASAALFSLYVEQARLLSVPADAYAKSNLPSAILRLLIQNQAGLLSGQVTDPADQAFLTNVPHEITAAEYLGASDLQLTVSLQRIWVRLLALEVARRQPERRDRSRAILTQMFDRDRSARHVAEQIRDGELAILQTWLLFAESPK